MRVREPQPFAAGCYGHARRLQRSYVPGPGQFGAPRARFEILEHNLVHLVVYDVAFRQRLTKIERNCSLPSGHRIFLSPSLSLSPILINVAAKWKCRLLSGSVESACYSAGVGEAETGSVGE